MATEIAQAVQDLTDQVTATIGVEASVVAYVQGVPALIDAAVAKATNFSELVAELGTLRANLKTSGDAVAAAVLAAPQAAPPTPPADGGGGPAIAVAPVAVSGTGAVTDPGSQA